VPEAHKSDPARSQENPAREFLQILLRGWLTIVLVFALVTGVVAYGAMKTPPMFEAESSLLVRIGREYIYRPEIGRTDTARGPSLAEMVNSEVEILSSRDLAEQVVNEIGYQNLYPELVELEADPRIAAEKAVLRLRGAASIRPVLESSVIKVGFEHAVPVLAADVVNLLVERFTDKHLEVFGEERAGIVEAQLTQRLKELATAEQALADFKSQNGVFDLNEQRRQLLVRREGLLRDLYAAEREVTGVRIQLPPGEEPVDEPALPPHLSTTMKEELFRQLGQLQQELRAIAPPASNRLIEELQLTLLALQREEQQLLQAYNETDRRVVGIREEIERSRRFLTDTEAASGTLDDLRLRAHEDSKRALQEEIDRMSSEIELLLRAEEHHARTVLRMRLAALEAQGSADQARIDQIDLDIRTLDQHEMKLRQLERALTSAEAAVQTYQQRADEARIGEELDREKRINVRVIEMAAPPVAPIGLPLKLKVALGAFVGLLTGAGLAVLVDLFRAR
jgi:uncharacterized protein involved in exopolysaccharide biosynthesis